MHNASLSEIHRFIIYQVKCLHIHILSSALCPIKKLTDRRMSNTNTSELALFLFVLNDIFCF